MTERDDAAVGNHAIVFGAGGLLGWAVANQLLSAYPTDGAFSKVTVVMNRPVPEVDLHFPPASPNRPELQVVPGVNLMDGPGSDLAAQLQSKVNDAESITHVFYLVFAPFNDDHLQECKQNCDIMRRVAEAMNSIAPRLKSIVYSGGTRGYGIYIPGGTFTAPLEESMADNLPTDYAKTVAYPWFREVLTEASKGRSWTWSEVCPDAVVGFSPNGSAFSLALHWAQYLSLYAYNHGVSRGKNEDISENAVEVPFPGIEVAMNSRFTPVSGQSLGRIAIHAALHPQECGGKVINMIDRDTPSTFKDLWPAIAGWFGLIGTGPSADAATPKPSEYIAKYKHVFEEQGLPKGVKCGVGAGSAQLDSVGWWLTFDRQLSPDRLRALGFTEQRDPVEGWLEAFEQLKDARIIF